MKISHLLNKKKINKSVWKLLEQCAQNICFNILYVFFLRIILTSRLGLESRTWNSWHTEHCHVENQCIVNHIIFISARSISISSSVQNIRLNFSHLFKKKKMLCLFVQKNVINTFVISMSKWNSVIYLHHDNDDTYWNSIFMT